MTASATSRSIRSIMNRPRGGQKLNIFTFTTHERYEYNLCKTGHNFYTVNLPNHKTWDTDYAPIPDNYTILDSIPPYLDFDMVLSHTSCDRLQIAHNILSETNIGVLDRLSVPLLRHTHVLPDVRMDVQEQVKNFQSIPVDRNSFISEFNMNAWGYTNSNASFVEHGVDTDFWKPSSSVTKRQNLCLSVVNDWPNRDWCCGFNLWRETVDGLPVMVVGKSPGFSEPAKSTEDLRNIYQHAKIFYNTSLHSPVPTVMLEAMACGCAIVSTATCMIPEIIKNGENGFISNDPQELKKYLELLLSDDELAEKMGNNARKTIEERYNLNLFCESWNDLLYSTIEKYEETA
jgi:hypothetical protein